MTEEESKRWDAAVLVNAQAGYDNAAAIVKYLNARPSAEQIAKDSIQIFSRLRERNTDCGDI